MRDNSVKYLVFGIVGVATIALLYTMVTPGGLFAAGPAAQCGNTVCESGESNVNCPLDCQPGQTPVVPSEVCGNGVCGTTESPTSCPADCTVQAGLTCPSDATTSFEVNVRDVLNETAYNRLAASVKKIGPDGLLIDTDTSSSSASTIMKVPCEKATYKLIAYDDDNSGIDIYPVEMQVNAYTVQNGALAGGRIPVTLNAKQQGNVTVTLWDSTGTQADKDIVFTTGSTNVDGKLMVREGEDDKAAANIMCLMNFTTSKFKKIEWTGDSPTGLTTQITTVPQVYSGEGGFEKAWNLFLNGKPLTLDGDSRTADPDRAYYVLNIYSYASTDPGSTHNVTIRCLDRMQYWEADGVTWALGGQPAAEDSSATNLGIQEAGEGLDYLVYD